MSAPFLPPKMAPRPAAAAVVPPITIAVFVQLRPDGRSTRLDAALGADATTRRGAGAGAPTPYGSYDAGRTVLAGYAIAVRGAYGSFARSTRSLAYIGRAS